MLSDVDRRVMYREYAKTALNALIMKHDGLLLGPSVEDLTQKAQLFAIKMCQREEAGLDALLAYDLQETKR